MFTLEIDLSIISHLLYIQNFTPDLQEMFKKMIL